ncbi:MAG: DUF1778 domain-containing protein [Beijerinckiaceae bacterium]
MTTSSKARFSVRFSETELALIDQAAKLSGQSRSDFVREAAIQAAQDNVVERSPIRMSPEGFAQFLAVIEAPARPLPQLTKILSRKAPWATRSTDKG